MRKLTKIVASIGPNSQKPKVLKEMILAGADVCRLNFSHDTKKVQGAKFDAIRKISKELDRPVAVIADLQGPKHRIGDFKTDDKYPLKNQVRDKGKKSRAETGVCNVSRWSNTCGKSGIITVSVLHNT